MIADNIKHYNDLLPDGCKLVAVSKLKPTEDIMEAYRAGQRLFGENYATELRDKAAQLPSDIEWHFIGHLQSKQLKYYIPFVKMIHGVDSWDHLQDVEQAAAKAGRVVDVLLQVHVAQEETKFGFLPAELREANVGAAVAPLSHARVCGLMAMASHTPDQAHVQADFHEVRLLFDYLKATHFAHCPYFSELSMGMSHDYPLAVAEGSTMVRIGSAIFGERVYKK